MSHRPLNPQALQLLAIDAFLEMARSGSDSPGATSLLRSVSDLAGDVSPSTLLRTREQFDAVRLALQCHTETAQKRR